MHPRTGTGQLDHVDIMNAVRNVAQMETFEGEYTLTDLIMKVAGHCGQGTLTLERGALAVFLEISDLDQRFYAEVSLEELSAFSCWRQKQELRQRQDDSDDECGWQLEDDWDMLDGGEKVEWVPEDPRKTLASDPAGQWLALLEHGPVKCSPGQDLPRVPAFEESWASEEENEGDSKEGVHAPSTDSPQAATRGASEAPEKDAQTRNLEIEADMATATEHAAPGGEAPVEEANPEDGVHEAGIANQTAANMMKQAQDDDGKQADEADDELSRKAATTAHAAAAAGEEATPCSEHDSDAGIATVTTAEAASGKARSNAQENAAVRLARLFQAPAPEAPEVPEPPEPGQRGRRLHTRARKSDPVQLAIAAGADEGFARAAAQKRRAAASNDEAARPKRGTRKSRALVGIRPPQCSPLKAEASRAISRPQAIPAARRAFNKECEASSHRQSAAMSSPKRKNGAAKLLKVDFSKEFESRGIPLEDSSAERDAKELRKVASFFGMDGHAVHSLMAQVEGSDENGGSEEEMLEELELGKATPVLGGMAGGGGGGEDSDEDEEAVAAAAAAAAARQRWLHRPVTPRELLKAKQPQPISINDFPSIFQRAGAFTWLARFAPLTTGDSLRILQPALAFRESGASQSDGVADGDDAQVHQKSKSDAQITVIRSFHRHDVLARQDGQGGPAARRGKAKDEEQSNRTIRTRQTVSWRCFVCDGGPSGKLGCLIRCDGCDKTFHMNCHDPPVTRPGLPNEKWYCSHCTEALAQHRALRLRPGDFAWARLKATSVLWPCVVLKLDFTKLDDPRPYWVNFFEGRKREQRGAWVGEEQVLQWSDGPMIPESASQRQAALRQAQAAGAGLFGTERCSPPETPRRKVTKVRSPGSGGTTTSSTTLPHSSPHAGTPSSRRPSHPNLKQEAQKIQALLQEAQQRQRRLEARLSTPSPYSTPNSV
eukprot:s3190_g5.t2